MKTQQEVEVMLKQLEDKITKLDIKLNTASNEFEFSTFRDGRIRCMAQYNILLKVLDL